MTIGSDTKPAMSFIPSGSILLDSVMGSNGWPSRKIIQLYGAKSSGKSLLCTLAAKYVTNAGKKVIWCDIENSYNEQESNQWRIKNGIDLDNVIDIGGTQDAEDILQAVLTLLEDHGDEIALVIIDSIGALTSTKINEKKMEKGYIDDNPKMVALFCRKINRTNRTACVMMVSHIGANIGSLSPKPIAKGGNAIQHFTAMRVEVRGRAFASEVTEHGVCDRHRMSVHFEKSKLGLPGGTAKDLEFDLENGGFDTTGEIIRLADGVCYERKGSYYCINDTDHKFQGEANFKNFLNENPEFFEWMFESVTGKKMGEYFNVD